MPPPPPAPSDSAGGSNVATLDDGGGVAVAHAPGIPAPPPVASALASPGHNPTQHADAPWLGAPSATTAVGAHSHGGGQGGGGGPTPAHSVQNSVFTARRWDRATGSTSTVGDKAGREDSAEDSCAAVSHGGGGEDAPVDSTHAQRRALSAAGRPPGRAEDEGEEVEGGHVAAHAGAGIADGFQENPELAQQLASGGFAMGPGSSTLGGRGGRGASGRGAKAARQSLSQSRSLNLGRPPVPLFNDGAATAARADPHSPIAGGTAAAARARAAEEAEGECELPGRDGANDDGAGGMDIGVGASEDGTIHDEHGYAPAYSEEEEDATRDDDEDDEGDEDEGDEYANEDDREGLEGEAGVASLEEAPARMHAARESEGVRGASGGAAPNRPAVPAVSGAAPVVVSDARGGLSAGPASGTLSGGHHGGGVEVGQAMREVEVGTEPRAAGEEGARGDGGFGEGGGAAAGGGAAGEDDVARGGRGFSGGRSARKNRRGAGGPSHGRAEVDDGGDESEDGEEGVSPAFVPAEEEPIDAEEQQQNA